MLRLHKGNCTGGVDYRRPRQWRPYDRSRGHKHIIVRRSVRGGVEFPARAVIDRHIRTNLPLVLEIEVVLIEVVLLGVQADLTVDLEWQEHVLLQIGDHEHRVAVRRVAQTPERRLVR